MQSVQYSAVFGDGALGLVLKNVEGYAVVHSLFCEISGEQGQAAEAGVTVGSQLIQVEGIPQSQQLTFEAITRCIRSARRPLRLTFTRLAGLLRPIPSRLPLVLWRGALQALVGSLDATKARIGRIGGGAAPGVAVEVASGEAELVLQTTTNTILGFEIVLHWTRGEYDGLKLHVLDVLTATEIPRQSLIVAGNTSLEDDLLAKQQSLGRAGAVRVRARISAIDVPRIPYGHDNESADNSELRVQLEHWLSVAASGAAGRRRSEHGSWATQLKGADVAAVDDDEHRPGAGLNPLDGPGSASLDDSHWLTLACKTRGARDDLRRSLLLRGMPCELALQAGGTGVARTVAQSKVMVLQRGILRNAWVPAWIRLRSDGALQWWLVRGGSGSGTRTGKDSDSTGTNSVSSTAGGSNGEYTSRSRRDSSGLQIPLLVAGTTGTGAVAGANADDAESIAGVLGPTANTASVFETCRTMQELEGLASTPSSWEVQPLLGIPPDARTLAGAADGGCCLPRCGVQILSTSEDLVQLGAPKAASEGQYYVQPESVIVVSDDTSASSPLVCNWASELLEPRSETGGLQPGATLSGFGSAGRRSAGSNLVAFACRSPLAAAMWRLVAARQTSSSQPGAAGSAADEVDSPCWSQVALASASALAQRGGKAGPGSSGQINHGLGASTDEAASSSGELAAENHVSDALRRQSDSGRFVKVGDYLALSHGISSTADLSAPLIAVRIGREGVAGLRSAQALIACLFLQGSVSSATRQLIASLQPAPRPQSKEKASSHIIEEDMLVGATDGNGDAQSAERRAGSGSDSDDSDWEVPDGAQLTPAGSPDRQSSKRHGTLLPSTPLPGSARSVSGSLARMTRHRTDSLAFGSPSLLHSRHSQPTFTEALLTHAASRMQPGNQLYDPALTMCVRWRVLRQLRALRERPSKVFADPLLAFTLLLRAASDLDQGAYAEAINTTTEQLSAVRCCSSAAESGSRLALPVCLSRPRGYRHDALEGRFQGHIGSVEQGPPDLLARTSHRLNASSSLMNDESSGKSDDGCADKAMLAAAHAAGFVGRQLSSMLRRCRRSRWMDQGWWVGVRWGWALLICLWILVLVVLDTMQGLYAGAVWLCFTRPATDLSGASEGSAQAGVVGGKVTEPPSALNRQKEVIVGMHGDVDDDAPNGIVWPAKDSLRLHWDVLSDTDSDLDDDLCEVGDLSPPLLAERRTIAREQVLRRHHFVQLVPRFLPLLADHYTAGAIYDALVEGTNPIMIGSVVRTVRPQNSREPKATVRSSSSAPSDPADNEQETILRRRWSSLPLSQSTGTTGMISDPTVISGSATDVADSDKAPRLRVSTSLERVLTFDQFSAFVGHMRQSAGVAHSDWDELRDKLQLDAREMLVRQEDFVSLVLTARARPPVYAIDGGIADVTKNETKECLGWYEETVLAEEEAQAIASPDTGIDVLEKDSREIKGGNIENQYAHGGPSGGSASDSGGMLMRLAGGGSASDAVAAYSWLLRGDSSSIASAGGITQAGLSAQSTAGGRPICSAPLAEGGSNAGTISVQQVAALRQAQANTAAIPDQVILAYRSSRATMWSLVAEVPAAPIGAWRDPEVEQVLRTELSVGRSGRSRAATATAPIGAAVLNRSIAEWRQQRGFQRILQRRLIRRRQQKAEGLVLRDHNSFEGFGVLTDSEANSDREAGFEGIMEVSARELKRRWSQLDQIKLSAAGSAAELSDTGANTPTGPRRRPRVQRGVTPVSRGRVSGDDGDPSGNVAEHPHLDLDDEWVPRVPFTQEAQAFVTSEEASSTGKYGVQLRTKHLATIRVRGTLFVSDRATYLYTGDDTIVIPHKGVRETQLCEVEVPGVAYGTSVQDTGLHLDVNDVRLVSKEKPAEDGLTELESFFAAVQGVTRPSQPPKHALLPRESYRTVRMIRRLRQRQAQDRVDQHDSELSDPLAGDVPATAPLPSKLRALSTTAQRGAGAVPVRMVPIKAVVPGTVRPQATLIFSPLKDLLLSIGEERLGGRRRVVKEAIDELVAAERLSASREAARASHGLGDDLYDLQRGSLVPNEVHEQQNSSIGILGSITGNGLLARPPRAPMGTWRARKLPASEDSNLDPDAEALRCATDALLQRDQIALRRILKRRKWEEGSRCRRLQRFSALQLLRTRALLKVTGRLISSLLVCTNATRLQAAERTAFDAVVSDACYRATLVQWASQMGMPDRIAALRDRASWWVDTLAAYDEVPAALDQDRIAMAIGEKMRHRRGAITAARRLLESHVSAVARPLSFSLQSWQHDGGRGGASAGHGEERGDETSPIEGKARAASGAQLSGDSEFIAMTRRPDTSASQKHLGSTKSDDRLRHLALITALSTPSPFLGISKEADYIAKGSIPADVAGKWTSRRDQALDGLRRAAAQAATVSSALVRCEEGGSRTRLATFAVETLSCEPEPTWLTHATAFAAREEEAWKRRHRRKHTFEMDLFRHEWNTLTSVLFKPFARAWQTYKYIRGWENPMLSVVFLLSGLVLLWSELTIYWPIICLCLLFFIVLFQGALGRNQQDRLSEVLIEPNVMQRKSLYESYVSFRTSMGTGMFRMRAVNRAITKFHALLAWRRPERTRIFLVLLGMFIVFLVLVPAKFWITVLALQQFTSRLRDGGMGVQIVALSRFVDGLPAPSAGESLAADGLLDFPSHPGTVVSCIAADMEAEQQVSTGSSKRHRARRRRGQ